MRCWASFHSAQPTELLYNNQARVNDDIRLIYHRPGNGIVPEHSHLDLRGGGDLQQNPGGKYSPLDVLPDSINGSPFINHGSPFDNLPKK